MKITYPGDDGIFKTINVRECYIKAKDSIFHLDEIIDEGILVKSDAGSPQVVITEPDNGIILRPRRINY